MRHFPRVPIALAFTAALIQAPSRAEPVSVAPFTLAILRQDGIIAPFASWTGGRWENRWPVPEKAVNTPITLSGIPRRWWSRATGAFDRWLVWQVDGTTTAVRATAPAWFPAHCQQGLGLRTTLEVPRPLPPPDVQPYPKIGVAMSRRLDLQAIERLEPASPVGTTLRRSLVPLVTDEEDRQVLRYLASSGWRHPYDDEGRRRFPLTIEAIYRAPAARPGGSVHYFEAVKRYPPVAATPSANAANAAPLRPDACEVVTFIAGWVVARGDETAVTLKSWRTSLTSCDFDSVDVMLPLASMKHGSQTLWIAQFSGWGRERYVLLDPEAPDGTREAWAAPGGTCQRRE